MHDGVKIDTNKLTFCKFASWMHINGQETYLNNLSPVQACVNRFSTISDPPLKQIGGAPLLPFTLTVSGASCVILSTALAGCISRKELEDTTTSTTIIMSCAVVWVFFQTNFESKPDFLHLHSITQAFTTLLLPCWFKFLTLD